MVEILAADQETTKTEFETLVRLRGRALSPMQRSLWASQLNHPAAPVQNSPLLTHLNANIDPHLLAAAFDHVVCSSDALRTRIVGRRTAVELIPLDELPRAEIVELDQGETDRWAAERASKPTDLSAAGYDCAIAAHPDGSASWFLNLHHLLTDALSTALVFDATATVYHALTRGDAIDLDLDQSYYRWAQSLQQDLDDPSQKRIARALRHWQQRPPAPRLAGLYRSVKVPSPEATRVSLELEPDLLRSMDSAVTGDYQLLNQGLAWTALLVTASGLLIHRVTGATDFAIGLPVHHRTSPETRSLIGPTMEVFPVDIRIELDDTHRSLHQRIAQSVMETLSNATPGTSPAADYECIVNVIPNVNRRAFGPIAVTSRWVHSGATDPSHLLRVQLARYVTANTDRDDPEVEVELTLDVNDAAAGQPHQARLGDHLTSILSALVSDADLAIGAQSICGAEELQLIRRWETTPGFRTETPLASEAISKSLAANVDVVMEDGQRQLTGPELLRRVQGVAEGLRQKGIGRGVRVGIELRRSIEAVIAIYAVHLAGGSFVPLDPELPRARRQRLGERAGCALVISSPDQLDALAVDQGPDFSVTQPRANDAKRRASDAKRRASDEAYLLFTSGSSGEPKGVPITDGGLSSYLRFATDTYVKPGQPLVAPLFSALTFDLTITSLFAPVLAGGRLVVIEESGPSGLAAIAARKDITWCKATPSHLEVLVRMLPTGHGLRTLIVGGEAFGASLAKRLLAQSPDLEIFNEYGPTEAVVGCMEYLVEPDLLDSQPDVPIGAPAPGVTLRVVDAHMKRVPIGSPGELLIAHEGLTSGYIDTAEDDQTPFVELDGTRFYRSGDLVRLQDDQRLVYLGRRDEQVKVGGIRLEPVEVEAALDAHPAIERSAVRLWSPSGSQPLSRPSDHCRQCGLPDNVPGVTFDDDGVCGTCHDFRRVAPIAERWFKTPDDLTAKLTEIRAAAAVNGRGEYDCLHLLSGGKDSTYALYKLVELGFRPYALTLDNGFISEGAKDNVRRSVAELGIDHEFATSSAMNAIFRDSLDRYSNVCHGCYKTIYTVATNRAAEIGAPLIVTGLSRGQLFETRLIPQQFDDDRFDPDAIDRAVLEARKVYHRVNDGPNRLLDTDIFQSDETFERIEYLDFYRYLDVELAEMLEFLEERAPWVRPADTGRSTNCLINAAGIHTHQIEQGYHNYAIPYAWDVRLGHKTRQEAIDELDDRSDLNDVDRMLREVGYQPKAHQVLTAWMEPSEDTEQLPTPTELRSFLAQSLPVHAIPAAFVQVEQIPLTENGKLDDRALPAPDRVHRPGPTLQLEATTELERTIIAVWERVLKIEPIGPEDDFFSLGGDSLAALETIVAVGEELATNLGEDLAFTNATPRALGQAINLVPNRKPDPAGVQGDRQHAIADWVTPPGQAPSRSVGELAVLFDQGERPDDVMYNVGRVYRVDGPVDPVSFEAALRTVSSRHQPLVWSHATPRVPLNPYDAVQFISDRSPVAEAALADVLDDVHRAPFDLEQGPLLRCLLQSIDDGSTAILLVIHHASGDAGSFAKLWEQIDRELAGHEYQPPPIDYAGFNSWQQEALDESDSAYWLDVVDCEPSRLAISQPFPGSDRAEDGFLIKQATVTSAELASAARTGPASVALAAVAKTLRSYSDGNEIEVGLITSTRNHPAAEDLFGYFLNTVPVRLQVGAGSPSGGLTAMATETIGGALAHRTYPTSRIVADRRSADKPHPQLDVLVAFDQLQDVELQGMQARHHVLWNGTAVAPLTFFIEVRGDGVDLSLEYRGSRISADVASDMLDALDASLVELVTGQALRPEIKSGNDSLLVGPDMQEQPSVLAKIITNLNAAAAANAVVSDDAVICGKTALTWAGLAERATAVAAALKQKGVKRGDHVVVCVDRSVSMVAAIIGTHLAGAAYVPIDPSYPQDRITLIADASNATIGLVGPKSQHLVQTAIVVEDTGLDGHAWPGQNHPETNGAALKLSAPGSAEDPAYVIFTSGSTGTPRGVPVTHGQLTASTNARASVYPSPPERFLLLSSAAFDSSIVGLFWTLAEGGTVHIPTEAEAHDLDAIRALLRTEPSHTLMVPSLYRGLIGLDTSRAEVAEGRRPWPKQVIVAGEACPPSLVAEHFDTFGHSALTNEYGPTETSVWATVHHCLPTDRTVPIGVPIPGAWVAVVDDEDQIRPCGVAGELIIGGRGVVDGYLDDNDATTAKFGLLSVADVDQHGLSPDDTSQRFFRTGDRAVVVDGAVRFLGRNDTQLNVGGMRAEPEDIENAVLSNTRNERVKEAVATAVDLRTTDELLQVMPTDRVAGALRAAADATDPAVALRRLLLTDSSSQLQLVLHVEVSADIEIDDDKRAVIADLRTAAADSLPAPLRPSQYVLHRRLPRTPNGKLDRPAISALPAEPALSLTAVDQLPKDQTSMNRGHDPGDDMAEETRALTAELRSLFGDTLRLPTFGTEDSFFEHGGHSLLAMELLLAIEDRYGRRLSSSTLYDAPSPRALASRLMAGQSAEGKSFLVPIQPNGKKPPIYAIHVLGLDCEFFRPLAAMLGQDQPMFGLGQPTADMDTVGPTEVADVAAAYADTIDQTSPDGPISLAAISLGGVVAYELAQQLTERGRTVSALMLFDALGPEITSVQPSVSDRLNAHLDRAIKDPGRYVSEQVAHQTSRLRRTSERASLTVRRRLNLKVDHRLEVRRFVEDNIHAQADYTFDPYTGRMLVIKAGDDPFARLQLSAGMGWETVAVGGLEVARAPGGHLSMMAEPNVGAVANIVEDALERSAETAKSDVTERLLIAGLRTGRLPAMLASLSKQPGLTEAAERLINEADGLLRALAISTDQMAMQIADRLQVAGLEAVADPAPRHLLHATASVSVTRSANDRGRRSAAVAADRVMNEMNFFAIGGTGEASIAAIVAANGWVDYIRREAATTRIRLVWSSDVSRQDRWGRKLSDRFAPNQRDFEVVNLPGFAWPLYWPIRPARLAAEILSAKVKGEDPRQAGLGIYLGTPPGLIGPLLRFAGAASEQVVVDLGCGDGRVLIQAAKDFGCRGRGYETDADLVERARVAVGQAGLTDRIEIFHQDAREADLSDADLIFAFLPPEAVASLLRPMLSRMRKDAVLLSHEQLGHRFPHPPDRSGLLLGRSVEHPDQSGITVANVWQGWGLEP